LLGPFRQPTTGFVLLGAQVGKPGSISALLLPSGGITERKLHSNCTSTVIDMGCSLFLPSCFLWVAWQLGTERVLQRNDYYDFFYNLNNKKLNVLWHAVTPFRCLAAMPSEGSTRTGILPGCPSLDRRGREAEVGFEPRTFRRPKWLEREFTDRKVRGSNPTSASRLPLSRLGQPGSIPALVLPSGGMAARHRKGATVERFFLLSFEWLCETETEQNFVSAKMLPNLSHYADTIVAAAVTGYQETRKFQRLLWKHDVPRRFSPQGIIFNFGCGVHLHSESVLSSPISVLSKNHSPCRCSQLVHYVRSGFTGKKFVKIFDAPSSLQLQTAREFTDRKVRGSHPTSASRLPCLGLGNLAIAQPSCFPRVAWQLGTERVLVSVFLSGVTPSVQTDCALSNELALQF
ncbi:hypothetical protein CSKR_112744, partial [Clonorchis sinensis]